MTLKASTEARERIAEAFKAQQDTLNTEWRIKQVERQVSRGLQGKSDLESMIEHGFVKAEHNPYFCDSRCTVCYLPPVRRSQK